MTASSDLGAEYRRFREERRERPALRAAAPGAMACEAMDEEENRARGLVEPRTLQMPPIFGH